MSAVADEVTCALAEFAERTRSTGLAAPVRDCARQLARLCIDNGRAAAGSNVGGRLHAIVAAAEGRPLGAAELGAVFAPLPAMSRSGAVAVNAGLMSLGAPTDRARGHSELLASALAAGLAAANLDGADGSRVLTAFASGAEVGLRLALAVDRSRPGSGWASPQAASVVAAAVTVIALLDGSAAELHQAIALGATQASGLDGSRGSADSAFVTGELSSRGFESGVLAGTGWAGPARPLDGPRGYFHLLTGAPPPAAVTEGLGTAWLLLGVAGARPTSPSLAVAADEPLDALSSAELTLLLGR
ncbi:MmgE/PrpD family protein [Nostocoides sp. HKS02]|uniref:MmgE/PrpD family protein n=1 Tax=Nostocoides sp. HKS02 TaxID=1813880 RepID=UPI0012B4AD52|nr:MmgE/PrpD family protein [Tetrasphaera sp. HKS02]QGN58872.1 hypothetical protein GKE56_14370 [Tetrasphaera sp. HKS02]